jgi:hypothetical protein
MISSDFFAQLSPEFTSRFRPLLAGLAKSALADGQPKEPALVPEAGARSLLRCLSFVAGKDVEIVLVRAKQDADGKPLKVKETLTYRQDVAGSDLVYDLTNEFMQGKARPFDCDLQKQPARLYALLPFQVESLSVEVASKSGKVVLKVEFRNGLDKRIQGALPCHAELRLPDGKVAWNEYLSTSTDGMLTATADMPPETPAGKWSVVVRSLLDGKLVTLPFEVNANTGK